MHHSEVIKLLNLVPLPEEGGYYRQTYQSSHLVTGPLGTKSECTAIYYLVFKDEFSALHWVDQDEIFHFYAGSPVEMLQIDEDGKSRKFILGTNFQEGHIPQLVAPRKVWQGTKLFNATEDNWALLGCTVSPGFEFHNFHLEGRAELIKKFPHLTDDIKNFTH